MTEEIKTNPQKNKDNKDNKDTLSFGNKKLISYTLNIQSGNQMVKNS